MLDAVLQKSFHFKTSLNRYKKHTMQKHLSQISNVFILVVVIAFFSPQSIKTNGFIIYDYEGCADIRKTQKMFMEEM